MSIKSKTLFDKIRRNNPYFEDFITRSVYHSNAIEGNTLSYADTYRIIFNENDMQVTATPRELYEAINLKYALGFILQNLDSDITLNFIKTIATYINKNIEDVTDFRKTQVFIKGTPYIPPEAGEVPHLVSELVYKMRKTKDEDLFDYLARFHIDFERIHPFYDGNGRTGRLLITKELLSRGRAPVVIPFVSRNKYINCFDMMDYAGLSKLLKQLNVLEVERMKQFGIKL